MLGDPDRPKHQNSNREEARDEPLERSAKSGPAGPKRVAIGDTRDAR
jgi:hypothetical protein